ncbi:RNase A-like domain-containing protein [Xanthomonas sp. WHRI 1810A]|uniref:RNase A-like domain-containing protein n=1 Tax=Xanthomonas sp. WHRI 1810A TaxID=3161565 RepID=UPI0032E86662
MYRTDDFRVTLSFPQMAAILSHESLSEGEIRSNRIFGSLRLVGGIIELAGAGVLCAIPEPISKVGCVAMGVHASDQLSAASTQILTGQQTDSFAFKAGTSVAESVGASQGTGQVIGLAMEFAVPLSTASLYNAFRVSSVRAGRMTVVTSEIPLHAPKRMGGGHTIAKHVEKTLAYLQKRFASKKVQIASTFHDLATAEWAVSQALQRNRLKILMLSKLKFLQKKGRYEFDTSLKKIVGWGISRNAPAEIVEMSKVRVVISFVEYNYMPYYIVTAFPVP